MYKIEKTQSQFENEWVLKIDNAKVGFAEVIFLSETSRSVNGRVTVFTSDCKLITYEYDGMKTGKVKSVAEFTKEAEQFIGDRRLKLTRGDEFTIDDRKFDNIVLIHDVTEDTVDDLMEHLHIKAPKSWSCQTQTEKVTYMQGHLRKELHKKLDIPMYDLVQKSKLKPTRGCVLVQTI